MTSRTKCTDCATRKPCEVHRCTGTAKSTGTRCGLFAIPGGTVCGRYHGGKAPQVAAAAARKLARDEAVATLALVDVHSIGNPLEELAAVAAEARALQAHLVNTLAEMGRITGYNHMGDRTLTPEYVAYERACDRVTKLLESWVRLGFDERMVALHERQATLVAQLLRAVLDDPELDLTDTQRATVPAVTKRHLAAVKEAA